MATPPEVNVKFDDPASKVSQTCLGTTVILRQILQQFSNSELLQLSLVNKHWNFEARSLLNSRGTLTARIRSKDEPICQSLVALTSDLQQMNVVPFTGMHIRLSHGGDKTCKSKQIDSHDLSYNNMILELLPWKILSVDFQDKWTNCKDCPAFVLVTKVLEDFHQVLEQVSFALQWEDVELFQHVLAVTKRCSFPRLKSLKLDMAPNYGRLMELAKAFVHRAPMLQELHFLQSASFCEDILEGHSAVYVPSCRFNPLYQRVCQRVIISNLRATEMIIYRRGMDFKVELLKTAVPMVLQASRLTLKTLRMDLLFALPLMCYGIRLENVTSLEIRMDARAGLVQPIVEPWTTKFLMGFNFSSVFPKLSHIDIMNDSMLTISADEVMGFIEQGNEVLRKTLPDRAINIQHLTMRRSFPDYTPRLLARIFPHVKIISVFEEHCTRHIPFTLLWEHFIYLRELRVIICSTLSPQLITNLDSVFCGIFPEEVAELREKDDEFLKAVNIVPVMPSITCMKDLRALTVRYTPEPNNLPAETDATFMFSKVTGLIGFAKSPALAVTFQTCSHECAKALSHMKPYVSSVKALS